MTAVIEVHVGFYSRVREKTKAFLTSLAFRSCISDAFEWLLHVSSCLTAGVIKVSYSDSQDKFETMYGLVFKKHKLLNSFLTVNEKKKF